MKGYLKLKGNTSNETHLEVSTGYELGGTNWYNGQTNDRGYYIYVTPVELKSRDGYSTITQTLGRGLKKCLVRVSRQSAKSKSKAEELALDLYKDIVGCVCREYGYEVESLEFVEEKL